MSLSKNVNSNSFQAYLLVLVLPNKNPLVFGLHHSENSQQVQAFDPLEIFGFTDPSLWQTATKKSRSWSISP